MRRRSLLQGISAAAVAGTAYAGPLTLLGAGKQSVSGPSAPVNLSLPVITGSAVVGQSLLTSTGIWANVPTSYAYQWKRDGSAIGGATGANYTLSGADEGTTITVVVTASNGAGAGSPATSLGVGPVEPAGSIPPSINAPVVGTDLTAVWNLQFGGTGPRSSPTNGTWAGSVDAYLISKGCINANVAGAVYLDVGSGGVTISNYDFGDAVVFVNGTGSATFNDCSWDTDANAGVNSPKDINGNFTFTGSTLVVTANYCGFDKATTFIGCGTIAHSHCRFRNQVQIIGSTAFNATGAAHLTYDWCYITGGGCDPAPAAHVELIQSAPNAAAPTCTFACTNTLVNFIDGQASVPNWGSAWTGVWSVGKVITLLEGNVFIGIEAVNDNPINPDVINCILAYGTATGMNATLTNNAMEIGRFGYTLNQNATSNRPVDGGGNRTFATNAALTAANFG